GHREHLPVATGATAAVATATAVAATATAVAATTTAGAAPRGAAITAAARVIGEAPARKEFLLADCEHERLTAIAAGEDFVRVTHADTSRKLGGFVSASRAWDWGQHNPRG